MRLICPQPVDPTRARAGGDRGSDDALALFLPHDYTGLVTVPTPVHARPYVAAAGRLEQIKGFRGRDRGDAPACPGWICGSRDRASTRPSSGSKHADSTTSSSRAGSMPLNVAALFRGARAVAVPSSGL